MSPFPKTEGELKAAGYQFLNSAKCTGPTCGADIEWWETPKGRRMPLDPGTMEPHWGTCPDHNFFRRKKNGGE